MHAWVTVEQGKATPPVYTLVPGQLVLLGRHDSNHIVVHDEHASRWHVIILFEAGRWCVYNLGGARNGTHVKGQRITRLVALEHGHEISIGDTRLRFRCDNATATEPAVEADASNEPVTPLEPDELTVLCSFLARSVEETDARQLLRHALDTILKQTRASVVGFLSLDAAEPLPKMTWPEQAQVDVQLSRQLTQQVHLEGRTVWLAAGGMPGPLSGSLSAYTDALCVPLRTAGQALGALHVYRASGFFHERHQRFCEVLGSHLASSLNALRARRSLEAENIRLRGHTPLADALIGGSPEMKKLRQRIARAAPRSSTVLIRGESGVGKELVALALHRHSPRRDGPLVVVNCAAIVTSMPEAELFGHCKGAFTGADRDRPGLFQQADEGTLFLDEVGELPLDCQAKLLRVIEGHGFRPVGATAEVRADVRIIAASNRDLEAETQRGKFRRDLLFRLQVIQMDVPPLRQHREDIPALVRLFLDRLGRECRRPLQLSEAALQRLRNYSWPGNVRQLLAVLESAAAMSDATLLNAEDLAIPTDAPAPTSIPLNLKELETWAIRQALQQTHGNISQAARLLGVSRDTLSIRIRRKGIDRHQP